MIKLTNTTSMDVIMNAERDRVFYGFWYLPKFCNVLGHELLYATFACKNRCVWCFRDESFVKLIPSPHVLLCLLNALATSHAPDLSP